MAFLDNYDVLLEKSLHINAEKEYKLSLFKHKKSGNLSIGLREFKHTASYDGVNAKNGITMTVNNVEHIDEYIKWISEALQEAKDALKEADKQ